MRHTDLRWQLKFCRSNSYLRIHFIGRSVQIQVKESKLANLTYRPRLEIIAGSVHDVVVAEKCEAECLRFALKNFCSDADRLLDAFGTHGDCRLGSG